MSSKITNILICGVGGQGVLTASEILGWAAVFEGYHVKKSEIHGMSQRGGSVESYVRFGDQVFSPVIPLGKADYLVPLDIDEHKLFTKHLSHNGLDLIEVLKKVRQEIKNNHFLNTFMLGVLSNNINISKQSWHRAIDLLIPEKALKENLEFFEKGKAQKTLFL